MKKYFLGFLFAVLLCMQSYAKDSGGMKSLAVKLYYGVPSSIAVELGFNKFGLMVQGGTLLGIGSYGVDYIQADITPRFYTREGLKGLYLGIPIGIINVGFSGVGIDTNKVGIYAGLSVGFQHVFDFGLLFDIYAGITYSSIHYILAGNYFPVAGIGLGYVF